MITLLRLTKKFLRYRTVATAIANAVITWIILIIAPLGLFAVIVCTACVFFCSLAFGGISDVVLLRILAASAETANLSPGSASRQTQAVWSSLTDFLVEQPSLDDRNDPPQFPRG